MQLKFSHVLRKYEKTYTVKRQVEGEMVGGRYEEGTPITFDIKLIIFPIQPEQLQDYEGGTYTTQDRKVYARIDQDNQLKHNDVILSSGNNGYEMRESTPWENFADFGTWLAKKVVVKDD